ncbi:MAG: hypothetical protein J5482_02505 [Oscillospiraceae bacterium]|nr:hypothetical protein [Oscillospiraceae bacterium]
MKKWITLLLCLPLLLTACGEKRGAEAALRRYYETVTSAEVTADVTCHLPDEARTFSLQCNYAANGDSTVTLTAPAELAGLTAVISDDALTLTYADLTLSAGRLMEISPANCITWLLRAAVNGYVLEAGHETLEDTDCLRLSYDTTTPGGGKVLCAAWFNADTFAPCYGEFSVDGELILSVRICSFAAQTAAENTAGD